ncbi:hypothetical protein [Streptomyces griseocarneus]|uniref:hypothetical protein n=1 Tax=Streptomyces griseocarneus TaxID=51201 RepID=UPI00167DD1A2|nr:hypothetical protein [Streptomyces griseocarneus]MBZ6476221.1 hypothetical protein [Streptomyces griseocarneus]GHG63293.1 hypothetical protein GCM10018779_32760 [Streptomyces griseocarneus]
MERNYVVTDVKITKARAATFIVIAASAALLASPSAWADGDSGEAPLSSSTKAADWDLIAKVGELEFDLAALIPGFDR